MKASDMIGVLAKEIAKNGDRRLIVDMGDGTWYEPVTIKGASELDKQDSRYIHLRVDFV